MAVDQRTFLPGAAPSPPLEGRSVPFLAQLPLLTTGIQPPAALWVDANDILLLSCRNSLTGVQLQVSARLMEPDGRIITPQFTLSPTADRTINTASAALYQGYLLGAAVSAIGGTLPNRADTYCVLKVNRMPAPSNLIHYVLGADYVSGLLPLEWPYGRTISTLEGPGTIYRSAATVPGAGADWSKVVPTAARWRIRGVTAQLVTSAAVATRQAAFIVDDGATTLFTLEAATTQLAGLTQVYNLVPGDTLTTLISTQLPVFIPPDLQLFAGWRLRSSTGAIQAADQWSAIQFTVEEWLED